MLNKPSVKEAASSRLGAEYFSIIILFPAPSLSPQISKNRNKFQKSNSCTAKIQKILIPKTQKIKI